MSGTSEIVIRQAQMLDCAGLARAQVDSYRHAYADYFPRVYLDQFSYEEQEADWRLLLADPGDDLVHVAQATDGRLLGYSLTRTRVDDFPAYPAELVSLHVRRAWQRQGIGTQLLRNAVTALRRRDVGAMMMWTLRDNPIRGWYERMGGSLLGERRFRVADWTIVEVAYGWLDLSPWPAWDDDRQRSR